MRRLIIRLIPLLLLVCYASGVVANARIRAPNLLVNGNMQDADLDRLPDGWAPPPNYPLSPFDGVVCEYTCWMAFGKEWHWSRGIVQHVDLVGAPPAQIRLSFQAQGTVTATAAVQVYAHRAGDVFPHSIGIIWLPNATFDNAFTLLAAVDPDTDALEVHIGAPYEGTYRITNVRLMDALLPVGSVPPPVGIGTPFVVTPG